VKERKKFSHSIKKEERGKYQAQVAIEPRGGGDVFLAVRKENCTRSDPGGRGGKKERQAGFDLQRRRKKRKGEKLNNSSA